MKKLIPLLALPLLAQAQPPAPRPIPPKPGAAYSARTATIGTPASNYVVKLEQMRKLAAGEGETTYLLNGATHGFRGLSFILTETAPGGGPPLHTHDSEEAHVLTAGTMSYVVGGRRFVVSAPYILRVPANTPHTFINAGSTPLQLTAVFDSAHYTFTRVADNPLQAPGR
ncbi:cupin domain-containing protein [Massilia oculi]|uniref:Cupin domain-containing protein n=1 Tax=Massilia hydrophila TaxID=3044279 RepID=A0ABS7YHH3_9BURK|nr:cupin domain-containing protein [Massilia oculi]MCA1857694.1 cupin domain-containing protein [Massilia oculi]